MSVKDIQKSLIITDGLTGDIIFVIDIDKFSKSTLISIIIDIIDNYIFSNEHGILIKVGYKN